MEQRLEQGRDRRFTDSPQPQRGHGDTELTSGDEYLIHDDFRGDSLSRSNGITRWLISLTLIVAACLIGCDDRVGDYVAASSIARNGSARDGAEISGLAGREVRIWGFVDHRNLYGGPGAGRILGDWWSGAGPSPTLWRFDLMANTDDRPGQGFQVHVLNGPGRDDLLRVFVRDARSRRPTKVFVKGKLFAFEAPTNAITLTGLYLELESSQDILFEPPQE